MHKTKKTFCILIHPNAAQPQMHDIKSWHRINQSINYSINQSINQSTNKSTKSIDNLLRAYLDSEYFSCNPITKSNMKQSVTEVCRVGTMSFLPFISFSNLWYYKVKSHVYPFPNVFPAGLRSFHFLQLHSVTH